MSSSNTGLKVKGKVPGHFLHVRLYTSATVEDLRNLKRLPIWTLSHVPHSTPLPIPKSYASGHLNSAKMTTQQGLLTFTNNTLELFPMDFFCLIYMHPHSDQKFILSIS